LDMGLTKGDQLIDDAFRGDEGSGNAKIARDVFFEVGPGLQRGLAERAVHCRATMGGCVRRRPEQGCRA